MSSINISVLTTVSTWLSKGDSVFLVTVIRTWGASPRPVGSLCAFNINLHKQTGSLSGGCVEDDLISYLYRLDAETDFQNLKPHLKRYGDAQDNSGIRLPCGGVLELLIEPLQAEDQHFINNLLTKLCKHEATYRQLSFDRKSGKVERISLDDNCHVTQGEVLKFDEDAFTLLQRLNPGFRLLIVGAGDVAGYLGEFAAKVDFSVTLCEPRKEVLKRLPEISDVFSNIVYSLPDDLIRNDFRDEYTAIVCLSHDPRVDDMALMEALQNSKAYYIGAMGSAKTSQTRRQRLLSLGLSEKQIAPLHAPIGMDIHSKTPPEIAISIIAELIKHRVSL